MRFTEIGLHVMNFSKWYPADRGFQRTEMAQFHPSLPKTPP